MAPGSVRPADDPPNASIHTTTASRTRRQHAVHARSDSSASTKTVAAGSSKSTQAHAAPTSTASASAGTKTPSSASATTSAPAATAIASPQNATAGAGQTGVVGEGSAGGDGKGAATNPSSLYYDYVRHKRMCACVPLFLSLPVWVFVCSFGIVPAQSWVGGEREGGRERGRGCEGHSYEPVKSLL